MLCNRQRLLQVFRSTSFLLKLYERFKLQFISKTVSWFEFFRSSQIIKKKLNKNKLNLKLAQKLRNFIWWTKEDEKSSIREILVKGKQWLTLFHSSCSSENFSTNWVLFPFFHKQLIILRWSSAINCSWNKELWNCNIDFFICAIFRNDFTCFCSW